MAEMRAKMAQMEADGAFGGDSSASASASASAPPPNADASPPSTLTFHCMVSPDPTQDASPSSWQAMASATLGNVTVSSGDTVAALKGKVAELLRAGKGKGKGKGKGASTAWEAFDLVYNTKRLVVDEGAGGGENAAVARVGDVLYRLEKESGRWPSPFAGTLWVARAAPKVASIFS